MNQTKPVDPRLVPPDPRPRVQAGEAPTQVAQPGPSPAYAPPAAAQPAAAQPAAAQPPAAQAAPPRRSVDATVLDPSALFGGADPTGFAPPPAPPPPAPPPHVHAAAHDADPTQREAPRFKGSVDATALFGPGDSPPSRKALGKPNVDSTVLASMSGPATREPVVAPVRPPAPEGARLTQEKASPVVFWASLVGAGLLALVLAIWLGVRETGSLPPPSDEPSPKKAAQEGRPGERPSEPKPADKAPASTGFAPAQVAMDEQPAVPSLPSSSDASLRFKVGERVRVARSGELPAAEIVSLEGSRYRVRFDDTGLEETVSEERIAGRLPKKR